MPPTLPRTFGLKVTLGILLAASGCKHVIKDAPVAPGPPIPAEPETDLSSMDAECAGLIAALDTYGKCPNLEDDDRDWVREVIASAEESFAAGKKSNPDEPAQKAIAMACHRAAISMQFATERCRAGKRPKVD